MRIEKIEIKGFGRLENVTLLFGKGMNVIYGSNESGKSTLQWFIKGMFFGLKGGRPAKDGLPPPLKRFRPWNGAYYGGSVEYRLGDGSLYRVERNFDTNTVTVYDGSYNNITPRFDYSKEKGPLFAEQQLGMNEACFERTVLVRQLETRLDDEGRAGLLERVGNAVQTGAEDVSLAKAENALKEALKKYVGTDRTRNSPYDRLMFRLEELKSARETAAALSESALAAEAVLNEAVREKSRLGKVREYLEWAGRLIHVRKDLEEVKAKAGVLKEIYNRMVETEKIIAASNNEIQRLQLLVQGVSEAAASNSRTSRQAVRKRREKQKRNRWTGVLLFLCAAAAGAAGVLVNPALYIGAGLFFIPGLILIIRASLQGAETEPGAEETSLARKESAELQFRLQELIRYKDHLKALSEKASAAAGCPAGSAVRVGELLEEAAETAGTLETELQAEMEAGREKYAGMGTDFFDMERLESVINDSGLKWLEDNWNYEREKAAEKAEELILKIREYETVLKGTQGEFSDLQELEGKIAGLELEKAGLEETGAALKLALEVLEEAAEETHRSYAPALNEKMSGIVQRLTLEKYFDLKADNSFTLRVVSPDTGTVTQIPVLSGGTADQMYLAMRLAGAELAGGQETLPVLLDEAFSQYDDHRTLETLRFLQERYSDGQVLLFTCKNREVELAEQACGGQTHLIRI